MTHLFLLGGHDLEMLAIRDLVLAQCGPAALVDKHLSWGAKASDYIADIKTALANGQTPVLVELADDLPGKFDRSRLNLVDHHGPRAGADRPSSLHQVFDLLKLPPECWTRDLELIAANDTGHIRAMREMGASTAEIRNIRDRDRATQGLGAPDEDEARRAIRARQTLGDLIIIATTSNTSSVIGDLIEPEYGGPGAANLLILMPDKAAFFGAGRVVRALAGDPAFAGGWYGGALPERGYWGAPLDGPDDQRRPSLPQRIHRLLSLT